MDEEECIVCKDIITKGSVKYPNGDIVCENTCSQAYFNKFYKKNNGNPNHDGNGKFSRRRR